MSVSVEKLENSMAKLTIEVEPEEFEEAIERAYNKQKGRINIPGFRKGKAPRNVIEKLYGAAVFYDEAANDVINKRRSPPTLRSTSSRSSPASLLSTLQRSRCVPLSASASTRASRSTSRGSASRTRRSTRRSAASRKRTRPRMTSRTGPVQDGDDIALDFEGFVDGVAFEGGKGENHALTIGSGQFIPGFEEQLVGAPIGEEVEVNVTFPENYQAENLKGKAAVFKCTVKSIREKKLPELDDAFADEVSEFSTLAEYREDVKKKDLRHG